MGKSIQFGWMHYFLAVLLVLYTLIIFSANAFSQVRSNPIIANHTYENDWPVPDSWIDQVQQNLKVYYGHASHGYQLIAGILRIENNDSKWSVAVDYFLPVEANSLCIMRQPQDPDGFFNSVQGYLNANPQINVAMFCWCGEANWYDVNQYFTDMQNLETANPNVTFVYMTGHAQEAGVGGYYRYQFNQAVRQFCNDNNKVLFDFADLDSWYNGEQNMASYYGEEFPLEHPQYYGDEEGHTTYESCENKGRALWWMLARVAGWNGVVPVELRFFKANIADDEVLLSWETLSESNNFGFEIERKTESSEFLPIGFIKGVGTTNTAQQYQFVDQDVQAGHTYYYRLKMLELNGSISYTSVITMYVPLPEQYNLHQNYPNPFNPNTEIQYSLPVDSMVEMTIVAVNGQKIKTLVHEHQPAGFRSIQWDGKDSFGNDVASGCYICRFVAGDYHAEKKIILLR